MADDKPDQADQAGQQHGDGDNAAQDVVQGDKVEGDKVERPAPANPEKSVVADRDIK